MTSLRLAARSLWRARAFTVMAMLTLALGVGLFTAVYTIADAVLLRPLPVSEQDRLVVLWGETRDGSFPNLPLSLADARAFAQRTPSLEDVGFFEFRGATPVPVRFDERVTLLRLALVSGNFFHVLRSRPVLGRALLPEDDVAGAAPVLVLSHRAWQLQFGGDSSIVGRSVRLAQSGRAYSIVGVMPQGLEYPRGSDAWVPAIAHASAGGFLDLLSFDLMARLRPGASIELERSELTNFLQRSDALALMREAHGVVQPLTTVVLGDTKPAVVLITWAAAVLLFLTCVNVANLTLVRSLDRFREFVVRAALGARRGRIVGQLLAESALISLGGGVVGIALSLACLQLFMAVAPNDIPRLDAVAVNRSTLLAALLATTATMLLAGVGPAIFMSRVEGHDALRSGTRHTGGHRVRLAAEFLVVAQVALAALSLTAAGLLARTLDKLQQVPLSFDPSHLLVASLTMRQDPLSNATLQRASLDAVVARTRALPGVLAVTPVMGPPFIGADGGIDGRLTSPGESAESATGHPVLNMEVAATDYFSTLGIPLLRGRVFQGGDRAGATPVIVVSASVAQHYWPDRDPIGRTLGMPGTTFTVVGVVPDTRYRELQHARPTVYFPLAQSPFGTLLPSTLLIRSAGVPVDLVDAVRRAVQSADPGVEMVGATPLETLLLSPSARPRLNAGVLALFGGAAISLAAIGLFAVIATMVRQRTREIGIRLALGATTGHVRGTVMRRGLSLAAVGAALGVVASIAAQRLLSALLFETSPTDATTLAAVVVIIVGVAAVASFLPAQSSARIDPVLALRSET